MTPVHELGSGARAPDPGERDVRRELAAARDALIERGIEVPPLEGKLLRPMVAYALVPPDARSRLDSGFWHGALAIQMAHEASLLHDDILDTATRRRGTGTVAATEGTDAALVLGDLYLTGAYQAAAAAGRPAFLTQFIEAVARTVMGEAEQSRASGTRPTPEARRATTRAKSGALFGAAAALGAEDVSPADRLERIRVGEGLGATYQRIDDLLDYCSAHDAGKPVLQDYRQRKWTWVLELIDDIDDFSHPAETVVRRFFTPDGAGRSPADHALRQLEEEHDILRARVAAISPGDARVPAILDGWMALAREAVRAQTDATRATGAPGVAAIDEVRHLARELGGPERWGAYFRRHAKTFRLATRLFPPHAAPTVTGLYAFCRFTDDLVDEPGPEVSATRLRARLRAWRWLTEDAWDGEFTGIPLLDQVVAGAAATGVSKRYPMAFLDGIEMDLERAVYDTWSDLEAYTFGVAGAVGGWITQGFGIHDRALLERAHALGHAMQLTNIARDVGEDCARGRCYLPLSLLHSHDLDAEAPRRLLAHGPPYPEAWARVVEDVLARADAYYERAWPGIRALPGWYRRPVAAAAAAYRGIHVEIRKREYDNLRRRAHTSSLRKTALACMGMARASRIAAPTARDLSGVAP